MLKCRVRVLFACCVLRVLTEFELREKEREREREREREGGIGSRPVAEGDRRVVKRGGEDRQTDRQTDGKQVRWF